MHQTIRCMYFARLVSLECEYMSPVFFWQSLCTKTILNQNYSRTMVSDNTSTIFILRVIINLLVIVLDQIQVEVEITCFGFQTFFMDVTF
jgi:hypothetical protein